MGRAYKAKVLCHRNRRNPKLVQDGKRHFTTVIGDVSAAAVVLLPLVIDKAKAHFIGWHTYVSEDEPAHFAYSDTG